MNRMQLDAMFTDGQTRLRALIDHPMESGLRKDKQGTSIDGWYIKEVVVKHGDTVLMEADWAGTLSKNPYFSIEFSGAVEGDELSVEWVDNRDETATKNVIVEKQS